MSESDAPSSSATGTSRRAMLRGAAGAAGGAVLAGGAGTVAAQNGPDFGGWFSNVGNFDGVVDRTGQAEVTVDVGAPGNNGNLAFGPAAIRVDPETTVIWEWTGEGGRHNVVADDGSFDSGAATAEAGVTFSHTFESEGITKYLCAPHEMLGMKGAVVVGQPSAGGGTVRPDWPGYVSDATDEGYEDLRGQGEVTIEAGPGGRLSFAPTYIWVDPGTTITWEFVSPSHNVKFESQPSGASLEGTPGGTFDTVAQGETHTVTAETGGMYTYFCGPHEGQGMKGAIAVGDDVPTVSTGDGGGPLFTRPENATTWLTIFAGSLFAVFLVPFGARYALHRRYPEGIPDRPEAVPPSRPTATEAGPTEELGEEPGHDEFDPMGTLSLVIVYLLILGVMWAFMYFIEFLGNGPTVIG